MNIAFITLGYRPFRTSGLDVSGERLVEGLLEEGHQVTVVAGKRGWVEEVHRHPALSIHRIPLGRTDWICFAFQAANRLNRLGAFDIVHFWDVHFAWAYRGDYVASLQHSFRQRLDSIAPVSMSPRWFIRFAYYFLARHLAEIPAIRRAAGLIAGSLTTRDEFVDHYAVGLDRVAIARHGVDTRYFRPKKDSAKVRERLGISDEDPVILFVGFITPRKGIEYLIEALPLINPCPRLVLVGLWRDEAYRQKVYRLLGSNRNKYFEAGFIPDDQMPSFYSMADVYVSPTLLEGFGLPMAESLACETPVVTSEAGSTREVLGPGGIIVPPRDARSLAAGISSLLQNESLRRTMGRKGRGYIENEFSLEKMVQDTITAYRRFMR